MTEFEQKIDTLNIFFRKKRDSLLRPILKIFQKIGISANTLSISKVFFTILYLLVIKNNLTLAMLFLIFGGVFLDFFDGPLARYTKKASDRGKFIDMFSDQLVYVLAIWGLMIVNIANPLILSYNIIIVSAFYLIVVISKNENKQSDWLIKPIARSNYYKLVLEISVISYLIFNISQFVLNNIIICINIIITFHFIYHFIKFANKKYFKNKPDTL